MLLPSYGSAIFQLLPSEFSLGFPTSRWDRNRSLICGKMLMGWAWKQYHSFCPHFTDQWTQHLVSQSLLTTRTLGYLFSLCAQKKEMGLVSSWSDFTTISLHQGTIEGVGWDNSWEALTRSPAKTPGCYSLRNVQGKEKATPTGVSPTIQFRVLSACLVGGELVLEEFPSYLLWVETQTLSTQLPQHLLKQNTNTDVRAINFKEVFPFTYNLRCLPCLVI